MYLPAHLLGNRVEFLVQHRLGLGACAASAKQTGDAVQRHWVVGPFHALGGSAGTS